MAKLGPAALDRFRGMFAFAVFDERTGDLVLARNPLSVKPLYYMPRAQIISDDQAGREDRSKQFWQLLSLEMWYRNAQAHGVAA